MKKIFITGGSGLIGSATIPFLKDCGYEVYALSTKRSGFEDGVKWVQGDIFDKKSMDETIAEIQPTHLLHLAWQSTGKFDDSSNYEFLASSIALLKCFAEHGGKRVVMAGTYAEYGYQEGVLKENMPSAPINAYSRCKAFLCDVAQDFCKRNGLSFGWARIFSVYGKERDARRLTADVINHLSSDEPIVIRSGSLIRDYIYVKDTGAAFARFLDSNVEGIVNICGGKETPIRDYVMTIAKAMGKETLVSFEDQASNQQPVVVGDSTRLNQEVGFTPSWSMEEGVHDILEAYRSEKAPEFRKGVVSVLLSIYNVEEYLEECLDSLLRQSYTNLEIVCVDNGSPDGCAAILERYAEKDDRIKIVTVKENKKLCGGRNAGLDNATGEYVCFVDPDDWVEEDYIKSMVDAIETKRDPDGNEYNLIVNYSAYNYYVDNNKKNKIIYNYSDKFSCGNYDISDYNKNETIDTHIPMWNRLYRKSILDVLHVRFNENINLDNIPFTIKVFSNIERFYAISGDKCYKNFYWRRLIAPDGELTPKVLFQMMDVPDALEDLYNYLVKNKTNSKIKIMYKIFFDMCFPRHTDMPGYYQRFKQLAQKMEKDIKTLDIYNQDDRNLCNLLIHTSNFFQFSELYFRPVPIARENYTYKVKLFGKITCYKQKVFPGRKTYYSIFKIPLIKTRKCSDGKTMVYLFNFIPLFSISK